MHDAARVELDREVREVGRRRLGRRGRDEAAAAGDERDEHEAGEAGATGGHRPKATIDRSRRRPADRRRLSARGPAAWRRAGGPSCRSRPRRGRAAGGGRASRGGAAGAVRRRAPAAALSASADGAGFGRGPRPGVGDGGRRRSPALGSARRRPKRGSRWRAAGPLAGREQALAGGGPWARSTTPARRSRGPSRGRPRARDARSTPAAARCRAARAAAPGRAAAATGRCSGSSRSGRGSTGRARSRSPRRRWPIAAPARNGSSAPSSRYSAAVGATSPIVRPSGDRPGPGLGDPDARTPPDRSRRAAPRRRPARSGRGPRSFGSRSGPTTVGRRRVEVARRAVGLDALDVERRSRRPSVSKRASMPSVSSPGNVQLTSCEKNRLNPLQPSQSLAQRPVESEVHATDRPRPYCHWARSGSSRAVTRTVCAADLAVVPL